MIASPKAHRQLSVKLSLCPPNRMPISCRRQSVAGVRLFLFPLIECPP